MGNSQLWMRGKETQVRVSPIRPDIPINPWTGNDANVGRLQTIIKNKLLATSSTGPTNFLAIVRMLQVSATKDMSTMMSMSC